MQKILNDKDCFTKTINIINLAWPDAGPEHYLQTWETEGVNFNADLVIVNIVETDYYRYLTGAKVAYRGHCITELKQKKIIYDFYDCEPMYTAGYSIGETEKTATLADPRLITARPFGFFAPFEYINNTQLIAQLQQRIAKDFTLGGLPTFGTLVRKFVKSLMFYLLIHLMHWS